MSFSAESLYECWWESIKHKLLIDRETFMEEAREWIPTPVLDNGVLVAVVMERGDEVHFLKTGDHQFTRPLIRSVMRVGMTTNVDEEDMVNRVFVGRMGFSLVGIENGKCHYRIERLRHG